MTNTLIEKIDQRLVEYIPDILARACENVGECTYAIHYPRYMKLNRIWFSSRHYNRPVWGFYPDIRRDIVRERQAMYVQPCLICEWCQRRKRFWSEKT